MFTCNICHKTLLIRNQRRHEESQNHLRLQRRMTRALSNLPAFPEVEQMNPTYHDEPAAEPAAEPTEPAEPTESVEPQECPICFETVPVRAAPDGVPSLHVGCNQCIQGWCAECDKNIFKCPYCRKSISGREMELKEHENQLIQWYATAEAMTPDPNASRWARILRMFTDFDTYFAEDPDVVQEIYNWVIRGGNRRTRTRAGRPRTRTGTPPLV